MQRVQDSIVEWVKQDNWQRIVAEKRSVLACMHQVLESCHTLLDSTHVPVDGVVRLLQHILRFGVLQLQWVGRGRPAMVQSTCGALSDRCAKRQS